MQSVCRNKRRPALETFSCSHLFATSTAAQPESKCSVQTRDEKSVSRRGFSISPLFVCSNLLPMCKLHLLMHNVWCWRTDTTRCVSRDRNSGTAQWISFLLLVGGWERMFEMFNSYLHFMFTRVLSYTSFEKPPHGIVMARLKVLLHLFEDNVIGILLH